MAAPIPLARRGSRPAAHLLICVVLLARGAGAQQSDVSLTLAEALVRAHRLRPQVIVAAAAVDRARGAARVATLIPNPQANAQVDKHTPTRQATVTQPLGWIVRRGPDVTTGRALVSRAAADSAQLLADLARDVRRAFYGALAANERLRLRIEQAGFADSLVVLADRRVTAGDISALERDQIAQEASRARLAVAQARELAHVASVELGRAVAWDRDTAPHPRGSLADALDDADVANAVQAVRVELAELATMPALRAAVADSTAAAERWRATRRAQIPVPAVVAGLEWGTVRSDAAVEKSDARSTPIFGLSIAIPTWNQGREAKAEARGAAAEAAARVGEARLSAIATLAAAQIRVAETAARARFARDSLFTEASRIRAGAVRLYDAGRTGVLPVIDALRIERDVAQSLVQELLAYQEARADLSALLGRWP